MHWAEVRAKTWIVRVVEQAGDGPNSREYGSDGGVKAGITYHTNLVESYDLRARNKIAYPLLQNDVETVLEWGVVQRKFEVKEVLRRNASRLEQINSLFLLSLHHMLQPAKKIRD